MNLAYLLLALAAGVGLAAQAAINSRLGTGVGGQPIIAAFISFTVGAVVLGIATLLRGNWGIAGPALGQQPWWRWTGGFMGAFFLFVSIFLTPRLGVANAMFLIIFGQLAAGMMIDAFGLFQMAQRPLHWWKYLGLVVMMGGLVLFTFGDRLFRSG